MFALTHYYPGTATVANAIFYIKLKISLARNRSSTRTVPGCVWHVKIIQYPVRVTSQSRPSNSEVLFYTMHYQCPGTNCAIRFSVIFYVN